MLAKPKNAKPKNAKPKNAKPKNAKPKSVKPKNTKPKNAKPKNAKQKKLFLACRVWASVTSSVVRMYVYVAYVNLFSNASLVNKDSWRIQTCT